MKIKRIDVTDIEGFRLGNAEDPEAGTGVTVLISEEGAVAGVDVRGGGPATRETDLLKSENTVQTINAVVLSGGSAFGLEAASGVMRALASRDIGFKALDVTVPIVAGASLFDLTVGRSDVFPDREMGIEAVENAFNGIFSSGNHGAGTGASVGKMLGMDRAMKTGLGTYACGDDMMQVGAVVAVNAAADVYNGAGNIIAGLRSGDGDSIIGTIRILKDMLYPESQPDVNLEDLRASASSRFKRNDADKTAQATRTDIAEAIQRAYELSTSQEEETSAVPDESAPVTDEILTSEPEEEAAGPDVSEDVQYEAEAAPEAESEPEPETEAEPEPEAEPETCGDSEPETEAEPEPEHEPEPEYELGQEPQQEAEPEPEPEPEPDPYELSDEEKADMGYDIPFNTTIACLITNARLTKPQANKLASILHDAYARAIKPVHSTLDGDTVFVMSTAKVDVNFDAFAALATDVLQYAIIDAAQSAEGAYGLPASRDINHR